MQISNYLKFINLSFYLKSIWVRFFFVFGKLFVNIILILINIHLYIPHVVSISCIHKRLQVIIDLFHVILEERCDIVLLVLSVGLNMFIQGSELAVQIIGVLEYVHLLLIEPPLLFFLLMLFFFILLITLLPIHLLIVLIHKHILLVFNLIFHYLKTFLYLLKSWQNINQKSNQQG